MGDMAIRAALIVAGLACVACEVWGSFDFMWEKYGRWNYLVVGSLVLTGLSAVLPLAAEYAHRRNMTGLKWGAWLAGAIARGLRSASAAAPGFAARRSGS